MPSLPVLVQPSSWVTIDNEGRDPISSAFPLLRRWRVGGGKSHQPTPPPYDLRVTWVGLLAGRAWHVTAVAYRPPDSGQE